MSASLRCCLSSLGTLLPRGVLNHYVNPWALARCTATEGGPCRPRPASLRFLRGAIPLTTLLAHAARFLAFTASYGASSDSPSFTYAPTEGLAQHTYKPAPPPAQPNPTSPITSCFSVLAPRLRMLFLWEENDTTSFNFSFRPACRPRPVSTLTAFVCISHLKPPAQACAGH